MNDRQSSQERIKRMIAENPLLSAGKMQVLGLDDLKARFGKGWPKVSERVTSLSKSIIQKRLGPGDVFVELDDIGHVLIFPNLTSSEAQVKCIGIATEVATKLFGAGGGDTENVSIRTVVGDVGGTIVMEDVNLSDAIAGSLEETGREFVVGGDGNVQDNGMLKVIDFSEFEESQLDFLSFRFRPVWDTKRDAIITYHCLPHLDGGSLSAENMNAEELLKLDILSLQFCCKQLMKLHKSGRKLILCCPVHYDTLSAPRALEEFIRHCRPMPELLRQSLTFEIEGLRLGVPQARLAQIIPILKTFSRSIICRIDLRENNMEKFTATGVHALGIDLARHYESEPTLMKFLSKFSQRCERNGLLSYVSNVSSRSLTTAVFSDGFRYVSGDAVRETCSTPDQAYAYELLDLFG